jgi:hypothetical protein
MHHAEQYTMALYWCAAAAAVATVAVAAVAAAAVADVAVAAVAIAALAIAAVAAVAASCARHLAPFKAATVQPTCSGCANWQRQPTPLARPPRSTST